VLQNEPIFEFGLSESCQIEFSIFPFSTDAFPPGLPDGIFSNQKPNLGNFWRVLQWTMLAYFMDIWSILQPFGTLNGHLVYFAVIWYISPRFGMLYQDKSGSPDIHNAFQLYANLSGITFLARSQSHLQL
jgi:hypothetical protein